MRRIQNWYFSSDIRFPALLDAAVADPSQPDIDLIAGRLRLRYRSRFFPSTNPWYKRHALLDFGPACPLYYVISPPEVKTLSQFEYITHLAQHTDASPLALHHVWYFRYWRTDSLDREFIQAHERFIPRDLDVNTIEPGQFKHDGQVWFDSLGHSVWVIERALLWRLELDPADNQDLLLVAIDYRHGVVVNQSFRRQRGLDQLLLRLARLGIAHFAEELRRFQPELDAATIEARALVLLAKDEERRKRERSGH